MQCAFCGRQLEAKSAWKGAGDQFYCSEFCADSEGAESAPVVPVPVAAPAPNPASLLQHHLTRPYERLERLLPYMRLYSGRAASPAQRQAF